MSEKIQKSSTKTKRTKTASTDGVNHAKEATSVVHLVPNPMFLAISLCSTEPHGKGTFSWSEVTCEKCLELKK